MLRIPNTIAGMLGLDLGVSAVTTEEYTLCNTHSKSKNTPQHVNFVQVTNPSWIQEGLS